jgi:hypothetical protein
MCLDREKNKDISMDSKLMKIAERAYHKFIMRGGEHGHDLADWLEAEKEIAAEQKTKSKVNPVIRKSTRRPSTRKRGTK